jgi:diguanylate cyclase (GGDEF)-like protein
LLYEVVQPQPDEHSAASVYLGLLLFSAFVIGFRYFNIYRIESRWKLAVETWAMIGFITWTIYHTGGLDSPLVNLYMLTIITSALALGRLITLLEVALIAACYIFLGYLTSFDRFFSMARLGDFMTQLAPMLLVAYITTMLSADIRNALSRIKLISETDELTGIYNMRAFMAIAERAHKQAVRHGHTYAVLMIDSDDLKAINDTYGHEAGNRLLKMNVACIQRSLRDTDIFARYGGDEFIVLLSQTKSEGAVEAAERIRKGIETTLLEMRDKQVPVTVSVGLAVFPTHGEELSRIMERADRALYSSKKGGRNRTAVSTE